MLSFIAKWHRLTPVDIMYLNTSHVIFYLDDGTIAEMLGEFKYISCYLLSHSHIAG